MLREADKLVGNRGKAEKTAKRAKMARKNKSEGVVTAPAARSPDVSETERAPVAAPPTRRPARPLPIPKDLVIDMVNDLAATEATGRGQRIRKPRKIFEEVAAPSIGKRKRAAVEEDAPITAAPLLSKKRAKTRDVSVVPTAPITHTPTTPTRPAKRKRTSDNDETASKTLPATKKPVTSRATSAAPPQRTTRATSRAVSAPPSRAVLTAPPRTITRATSRATSAAPFALKAEAESTNRKAKAKKRPAAAAAAGAGKGKGKGKGK